MSWWAPIRIGAGLAALAAAATLPVAAQYPGQLQQPKNTPELRAVAVLEWTGDEQHPKASRIIPVSVFDGQELQDGGIYLAQPEPLALEGEVEYQLKQNGKNVGLFVIENAAQEQGSWVGYGAWKPLPGPKPAQVASAQSWSDEDDAGSDRPILHRKAHPGDTSGGASSGAGSGPASQGPAPDPDRPTLHRTADSGDSTSGASNAGGANSGSASSGGSGPAPDPDRPTLHRSPDDSAKTTASNGGTSNGGGGSSTDPDRPKLKKKSEEDDAYVSSLPDISDPDRPRLIRGKSSDSGPAVLPSLLGLPPDMEQAVAVSDSKNTPEHIWSFSWANPGDEAKYKADLEEMARTALGLTPPAAQSAPKKTTARTATRSSTRSTTAHKKKLTLPPPPPPPLLDEHFRVFELAYGSGATMVLSAHTAGTGEQEKFVTLVAQPDLYGDMAVLVKNVTDAAHLDDTPRMRLVDAVDAMADNRGELLFELRGATQRQFALYRVLRGQAIKLFVTGSDPIVTASAK